MAKNVNGVKFYLVTVYGKRKDGQEVCASITLESDNLKPVFVRYCGSDTGFRSVRIGNAERKLKEYSAEWRENGLEVDEIYLPVDYIPVNGSDEWNRRQIMEQYGIKNI